jgi:type IV pilus biogenesis protein CpaD/CtpE
MALASVKMFKMGALSLAVLALMGLSACDLQEGTMLSDSRVQVRQDRFSETVNMSRVDAGYIDALAARYNRYGDGPVQLTVAYDPQSKSNTAMRATQALSSLTNQLKKGGVKEFNSGITPVRNLGNEARVLISFDSYSASAPKDCTLMSGTESRDLYVDEEYKLGCTTESMIARQIARPKDLKGNAQDVTLTDGRRSSSTVETYRTGVPNEPLGGESSSE